LSKVLGVFHHESEQSSLKTLERLSEMVERETRISLDRAGITLGPLLDPFSHPEDGA
jgi:hypothetical protein